MSAQMLFIVGYPGVGKSTFADAYSEISGEKSFNGGDVLVRHFKELNINSSRRLVGKHAIEMIGENGISKLFVSEVLRTKSSVIDGVRLFSTYEYFIASGIDVDVLMILMDDDKRRKLLIKRDKLDLYGDDFVSQISEDSWGDDWGKYYSVRKWEFNNNCDKAMIYEYANRFHEERILQRNSPI